jgi:hypothetical protein
MFFPLPFGDARETSAVVGCFDPVDRFDPSENETLAVPHHDRLHPMGLVRPEQSLELPHQGRRL